MEQLAEGMTPYLRGVNSSTWNKEVFNILLTAYDNVISKNLDYGKESIMRKDKNHAIHYVIDQLFSKLSRIEHLFERNRIAFVNNESIDDTVLDTIGYSVILLTILKNTFMNITIPHKIDDRIGTDGQINITIPVDVGHKTK